MQNSRLFIFQTGPSQAEDSARTLLEPQVPIHHPHTTSVQQGVATEVTHTIRLVGETFIIFGAVKFGTIRGSFTSPSKILRGPRRNTVTVLRSFIHSTATDFDGEGDRHAVFEY